MAFRARVKKKRSSAGTEREREESEKESKERASESRFFFFSSFCHSSSFALSLESPLTLCQRALTSFRQVSLASIPPRTPCSLFSVRTSSLCASLSLKPAPGRSIAILRLAAGRRRGAVSGALGINPGTFCLNRSNERLCGGAEAPNLKSSSWLLSTSTFSLNSFHITQPPSKSYAAMGLFWTCVQQQSVEIVTTCGAYRCVIAPPRSKQRLR